jgi:protein O-mannosyl-transferase
LQKFFKMIAKTKDRVIFWALVAVMLTGLIITYSNHFNNPFHFDDDHTIANNLWIRKLSNIPTFFVDGTTSSALPQNQAYRPGLTTLNAIDYYIASKDPFKVGPHPLYTDAGLKPFYFHLDIFICFILQALLMFLLFKKILDISINHRWNKYFALIITAIYCYHAALAETLNYIISRSDGFSTLMVMLALTLFIYFPKMRKYQVYLIPFIFGFFVKEPALMFAPILFVYIILFEKQINLGKVFQKENLHKVFAAFKTVLLPLLIAVFLYFFNSKMQSKTFSTTFADKSKWDYLITEPFVIVQYFKTFLLPTELSADTDWKVLASVFDVRFFMGMMFITGMIWLAVLLSKKAIFRPISFGIFWFFIALIPTSSFIPLFEVLNDHRIFFPFIGLALATVWILIYILVLKNEKKFQASTLRKGIVFLLIPIIIIPHAITAHNRSVVWSSFESLWYDVTIKCPENGKGYMNYALSQMRKGNYKAAKINYEKALRLSPNYDLLYINLGILYSSMGDNINAEKFFKNAVLLNMYTDQDEYYYGNFLYEQKRYEEAKIHLKKCIDFNPRYTDARYRLMEIYFVTEDWGNLKEQAEETLKIIPNDAKCITYLDAAQNKKTKLDVAIETAKSDPTPENYINLSLYYYQEGSYEDCIKACEEALKIKPDYALAYNNICSAYNELKQYDKAIEACNKALAIQPDYELAKNNLKSAQSLLNK